MHVIDVDSYVVVFFVSVIKCVLLASPGFVKVISSWVCETSEALYIIQYVAW